MLIIWVGADGVRNCNFVVFASNLDDMMAEQSNWIVGLVALAHTFLSLRGRKQALFIGGRLCCRTTGSDLNWAGTRDVPQVTGPLTVNSASLVFCSSECYGGNAPSCSLITL